MTLEEFQEFMRKRLDDFAMGCRDEGTHRDQATLAQWWRGFVMDTNDEVRDLELRRVGL